jgi:hypothetical protein
MMTIVAAWAVMSLRSPRWRTGLVAAQSVLGIALIGLLTWQAIFHPFDLGSADRTRMLRGWSALVAEVHGISVANDAQSILTDGTYRLSGELFFYFRAAGDPRPVRNLHDPWRYDFIPAAERYPHAFPALFVVQGTTPPTRWFAHIEPAGTLLRDTGNATETYTAFIVSEPTAAFPTAD